MYDKDSKAATFGEEATNLIISLLKKKGWKVIRLDKTNDDASALFFGSDEDIPAMDILAIGRGKTILLDSKAKSHSTYTYTQGREDHGIDKGKFDDYIKQCKEANLEPWIALYEDKREVERGVFENSGYVLLYRLDKLMGVREVGQDRAKYGRGGMVYWFRGCYQEKYKVDV